jgi:hypothetical protein
MDLGAVFSFSSAVTGCHADTLDLRLLEPYSVTRVYPYRTLAALPEFLEW